MHNEKNHSLKHGGGNIAKYGYPINMSCDVPEDGHKFWVKEPGANTNQGPEAALSMMQHSLRKEASALLCEGVHGIQLNIAKFTLIYLNMFLQHGSRTEMSPPGLNKAQVLGKQLFCALIVSTAAIYKIQNPRKNAWVLK